MTFPRTSGGITVYPLDRFNWEAVAKLKVKKAQEGFLPSNLHAIAESRFEDSQVLGIRVDEMPVGMAVLLFSGNVAWISRLMIGGDFQGLGYGKAALQIILGGLKAHPRAGEVKASVAVSNKTGLDLFEACGFQKGEDPVGEEWVLKWEK